jgi:hypothetical protein
MAFPRRELDAIIAGMSEARRLIPELNANETRRGRSGWIKTLVSWAVVFAALTALYSMTHSAGVYLFVLFPVALTVIMMVRFNRQMKRFHRDNDEAVASLARGELQRARDAFWTWAERATVPRITALARHNLGWTLMRQGELEQAIAVASDNVARNEGALAAMGMLPTSGVDIALYHALRGDSSGAEQWLTRTDQWSGLLSLPTVPALKAFVRAVLACRAGLPDDAARLLDERWAEYEGLLTGDVLRPLRIVRAFAIAAGGPRNAGIAEAILGGAGRPAYPDEYDFLGVAWPEMASFLASHRLARPAAADDGTAVA